MTGERIIIVGGGIAGAATAWWLARRGAGSRVVLLEREEGLGQHSTGKNAALLGTYVAAHAARVLSLETARFLRQPPDGFAEVPLLDAVGVLLAEGTAGDPLPLWVADHLECDEVEQVDQARAAELAPHFRPAGERLWWFPRQGRIDIAALLDAFVRGARAGGVEVRTEADVVELMKQDGAVTGVRLADGERLTAGQTVLAAGGWATGMGATAGSRVQARVTRRHLLVTGVDARVDPCWPVVWDDAAGVYARPESGGLLISAMDLTDVEPDHLVEDRDVMLSVAEKAARHLPDFADATAVHFWPGLRTLTEDDSPHIGADPDVPGLFWVAGLGGHGMTACAGIGRVAAELLVGEELPAVLRDGLAPGRPGDVATACSG